MEKEKYVYGIDIGKYENWENLSDEEVVKIGEENGMVYSFAGFVDELNYDQLDTQQYFFRIV